jgi:hypothetical protein
LFVLKRRREMTITLDITAAEIRALRAVLKPKGEKK